MKYIGCLLSALIALASATANAMPLPVGHHQMESITAELNATRLLIQKLTQDNAQVLCQFDLFAKTLKEILLDSAGISEKELFPILHALRFSAEKHRSQTRKDPQATPYIIHPIAVADSLLRIGNVQDPEILIGALLHDTVEDTDTSFEEIEQQFGIRVTGFIREVTDDKSLPKQRRKQLQIEHAPEKSPEAAQIKLADKLCNLRDLSTAPPLDWEQERVDRYFEWAKQVVDRLPKVNAALKQAVDSVIEEHWKRG
jgi:guanosine-3',5'-bis(diphosphate) 3'-pyrophosphohydrolase